MNSVFRFWPTTNLLVGALIASTGNAADMFSDNQHSYWMDDFENCMHLKISWRKVQRRELIGKCLDMDVTKNPKWENTRTTYVHVVQCIPYLLIRTASLRKAVEFDISSVWLRFNYFSLSFDVSRCVVRTKVYLHLNFVFYFVNTVSIQSCLTGICYYHSTFHSHSRTIAEWRFDGVTQIESKCGSDDNEGNRFGWFRQSVSRLFG